jgi:hypothetical protein
MTGGGGGGGEGCWLCVGGVVSIEIALWMSPASVTSRMCETP